MFLVEVIFCVLILYGILSLVQDVLMEITYKKVTHDMKIVVFSKNVEKKIEQFIIELSHIKKMNGYKQIVVVDLEKSDDIEKIKSIFSDNEVNVDLIGYDEGKEYVENLLKN